jgi:hypothetical protein
MSSDNILHKEIITPYHRVNKTSYSMYDQGILHFEKAEELYALRGWKGKGVRHNRKRLCDRTYLLYDEDEAVYYVNYQSQRIITILHGHNFTVHGPRGWHQPGLISRLDAFLPCPVTANAGVLYCGRNRVRSGDSHHVSLHSAFDRPYWYWNRYSTGVDSAIKTPLVLRELLDRMLAGYFYNYFSAYSQVPYTQLRDHHLTLNFRTQSGAGCNVKDSFLINESDGSAIHSVDKEGHWMRCAYGKKAQPVSVIMQALAYLMEYRFNVRFDSPTTDMQPWKAPEFLRTFEGLPEFPGFRRNSWRDRAGSNPYVEQIILFTTARSAVSELITLFYAGHSDRFFKHRVSAQQIARTQNRNRPIETHGLDKIRGVPFGNSSQEMDPFTWGANNTEALDNGTPIHVSGADFAENYNMYFPRTILFSILDFLVKTEGYSKDWLDSVCEKAFTMPDVLSNFDGTQSPLEAGHPETPSDAHDILLDSRFAPLYTLLRKFFLDRFSKLSTGIDKRDFELAWATSDYYYAARGYMNSDGNRERSHIKPHTFIRDGISPAPSINDPRYLGAAEQSTT